MLREEGGGSFLEAVHKYKQIVRSLARPHFKCILEKMEIGCILIVKCLKSVQETKSQFPKSILIPLPYSTPH